MTSTDEFNAIMTDIALALADLATCTPAVATEILDDLNKSLASPQLDDRLREQFAVIINKLLADPDNEENLKLQGPRTDDLYND